MQPNHITPMPRDHVLLERAVAVAAFTARVVTAGMTRPPRAEEERAFLTSIGAVGVFLECPNATEDQISSAQESVGPSGLLRW